MLLGHLSHECLLDLLVVDLQEIVAMILFLTILGFCTAVSLTVYGIREECKGKKVSWVWVLDNRPYNLSSILYQCSLDVLELIFSRKLFLGSLTLASMLYAQK